MTSTEIRPATPELMQRFYGAMPKKTSEAIVAVRGERVLGVAGVYREIGASIAFSELTDELKADKRALVQGARALTLMLERGGRDVYAMKGDAQGADVLLRHIGFEPAEMGAWVWRA